VEPDIYSTPVTEARVGQLYTYDVQAIGNPAPTYSLVTSPAGMSIDGSTGLIQWIPPDTTDVLIVVEASNSVGSDFQGFTIVVEEAPDCPPEMVSYWQLDETSGTTYEDFYDDNDGEASPTPPAPSGDAVVGGSQSFNGTDNWIDVPDANNDFDWTATSSFSIEIWAKFTNVSNRNKVMIGRDQGGGDPHWWLGAQQNSGLTMFNLLDNNSNGVACTGFTAINNNQWHHIVAVRDESLDQNRIYVDGVLEDTQTHNYTAGFAATTPLGIGYMAYNYNPDYFYEGLLDEVALYDRVLSEAEISDHYASGLLGQGYCTMTPEAPQIVSVPVTTAVVSRPYSYDVHATGFPTPTYDLTVAPAGMTIDTFTGLIEWTPPDTGTVDVTVVATNSEGSDSQSYDIYVAAAPDCPLGMTAYWQLNETSGNSYEDIYDGHHASAPVSVPTPATDGVVEGCQDFNGTSDYIEVPDHADFDWPADASFSIEVWAKFTNVANRNKVMIGRDQDGGSPHWWLGAQQNTGQVVFNLLDSGNNGVACFGTTAINDDEWHHIVAVRDESSNQNRIYVDGDLEDTSNHDYTSSFAASTPLGIGFMAYNYNPDYYYDGKLDEVALYDRVLSEVEIDEHYTNGLAGQGYCNLQPEVPVIVSSPVTEAYVAVPYQYDVEATGYPQPTYGLTDNPAGMTIDSVTGLIEWTPIVAPDTVGVTVEATNDAGTDNQTYSIFVYESPPCPLDMVSYWRWDETAGPPYADIHGGYDASGVNYPTPASGILGGAQWFDGSDDEVDVPSVGQYDWGGNESFSIELWMKTSASTSGNRVIVGRDDTVNPLHWWVGAHDAGQAHFGLKDTAGDYRGVTGTSQVNDGDWHHIVAIRNASFDSNIIYVDGVKENGLSYDYTGSFNGSAPLNIGYLNLSGHYRYEGNVDEIAIYDRALSPSEIQNHYNSGTGREYCDPMAPEFTSLPNTSGMAGAPYSYDAETTGIPTPTYALTENPSGMTIDSVTGVISWTPPDNTDASVTIQASNSAGTAEQSFIISVADAPACPAQLSHYWPLDETTGPPYEDIWGGTDADCSLCPGTTSGRVGSALWFDGSHQVDAPDDDTLDWPADASFTMAYWMRTGQSTSGNRVILGRDDSGTDLHWWTGPNDDTTASFQLRDTAGNGIYLTGQGPALNDDVWHFVVCVRDDSQDSNFVYVDGVQVNAGYHDYTNGFGSGVSLNIGYINLGGLYRYHGAIDEIAVYDRALPPGEIKQQYDNGRASHGYCDVFAPVFVSAPVLDAFYGDLYIYDCDAGGNPVPTYALAAGPDGMTIDPVTGLIEWTPDAVRPEDVTVTATNSEGTAEHQFTIAVDGPADVDEIPQQHFLAANHPNPFNPMTRIRFGLPHASQVEIAIFDISGRRVTTLVSEAFQAGVHEVTWTGRNDNGEAQASGIYFYRLRSETFTQTRKMTLLK
jgi:uncharacterized protein (DUF1330 family)